MPFDWWDYKHLRANPGTAPLEMSQHRPRWLEVPNSNVESQIRLFGHPQMDVIVRGNSFVVSVKAKPRGVPPFWGSPKGLRPKSRTDLRPFRSQVTMGRHLRERHGLGPLNRTVLVARHAHALRLPWEPLSNRGPSY